MLTEYEIDRIIDMWLNKPCTFAEIVRDINQFRDIPASIDEIEEIIDKIY